MNTGSAESKNNRHPFGQFRLRLKIERDAPDQAFWPHAFRHFDFPAEVIPELRCEFKCAAKQAHAQKAINAAKAAAEQDGSAEHTPAFPVCRLPAQHFDLAQQTVRWPAVAYAYQELQRPQVNANTEGHSWGKRHAVPQAQDTPRINLMVQRVQMRQ